MSIAPVTFSKEGRVNFRVSTGDISVHRMREITRFITDFNIRLEAPNIHSRIEVRTWYIYPGRDAGTEKGGLTFKSWSYTADMIPIFAELLLEIHNQFGVKVHPSIMFQIYEISVVEVQHVMIVLDYDANSFQIVDIDAALSVFLEKGKSNG